MSSNRKPLRLGTLVAICTVLASLILGTVVLADEPACHTMPSELVDLAQENGFAQIEDFYYKLPGFYGHPYVYGYDIEGDEENSVVFWATKTGDSALGTNPYYLLLAKRDSVSQRLELMKTIQWSSLGVLYLPRSQNVKLADCIYVDSLNVRGPDTTVSQFSAFVNENEGSTYLFFEYEGNWLILIQSDW